MCSLAQSKRESQCIRILYTWSSWSEKTFAKPCTDCLRWNIDPKNIAKVRGICEQALSGLQDQKSVFRCSRSSLSTFTMPPDGYTMLLISCPSSGDDSLVYIKSHINCGRPHLCFRQIPSNVSVCHIIVTNCNAKNNDLWMTYSLYSRCTAAIVYSTQKKKRKTRCACFPWLLGKPWPIKQLPWMIVVIAKHTQNA